MFEKKVFIIRDITYRSYDLMHQGHINLIRRAKGIGFYLQLVLLTTVSTVGVAN